MARTTVVGIDVGSAAVRTLIASGNGQEGTLRVLGMGSVPSSGVRRGAVVDPEAVARGIQASVRAAERQAGERVRSAYVSVGGAGVEALRSKGFIVVSRASGEISEHDVLRVVEVSQSNIEPIANREILHRIPLAFTVDGTLKTVQPVGLVGSKLECETLFLTALSKDVRALIRAFELAGVLVEEMAASPMASSRAMLTARSREVGVVLVDVGEATATLAVFEDGLPKSFEVLPFGSANITHDIAIGFRIPIEEAEEMKLSLETADSARKKQLSDIIAARLSDIFELTNKHLKKIERARLLPAGAVLTGGGARLPDIASLARESLELPAQVGPLQGVSLPNGIEPGPWAVSAGLCLLAHDNWKGKSGFAGFDLPRRTGGAIVRWLKSLLP